MEKKMKKLALTLVVLFGALSVAQADDTQASGDTQPKLEETASGENQPPAEPEQK